MNANHATPSLSAGLGNVLTTISDRKKRLAGTTPAFEAVIETAQDYYPFGSLMPGRKYNAGEYRFGFNGKEKNDEVTGVTGATYDYGFRIYDSRISRFLSIDPLFRDFAFWTPYQFGGNTPIQALDLDGLEILDFRALLTAKVTKVEIGKIISYEISLVNGENNQHVHSKLNSYTSRPIYKKIETQQLTQTHYTGALAGSNGKLGELSKAQKYSNNNPTASNTAAGGSAALFVTKTLYEFTNINRETFAEDVYKSLEAFGKAFSAVAKYSNAINSTINSNIEEDQFQFQADIINYIVDKRLDNGVKNGELVKRWGDFILKREKLNDRLPSARKTTNKLYELYIKVAGGK